MRTLIQLAGMAAITLAGASAQATDFAPLMDVVQATWPGKNHIGVVANYRQSQPEIQALAAVAGAGSTITVLDIRGRGEFERAGSVMVNQVKPDYLVLLPQDPLVWDGSFNATLLTNFLATRGIPTVATTPKALAQGAVFAMGAATGMELLVTQRLIGTVGVILPSKGRFVNHASGLGGGSAQIRVASLQ